MNVVVVDWDIAYPPDSGKRLRTLNLLLELADRHHITYLSRGDASSPSGRVAAEYLGDHGIRPIFANCPVPKKRGLAFGGRLAANLLSPVPYAVGVHRSPAMQRFMERFAAENSVDVWQLEWTPYVEMLCHVPSSRTVLMAHNVDSLIWQRYAETESRAWVRPYVQLQRRRFERYERQVFSQATRVVAVSNEDAALAQTLLGLAEVDVVDNGVDIEYFAPRPRVAGSKEIVFVGSLDWRPNVDAIHFLLDSIWPRIHREIPDATMSIVGRNPAPGLVSRIQQSPGCTIHASVPDVRPFMHRAAMMLVPLRIGGGSRLKILEAAACALPVVSTTVGAEGLKFVSGQHLALADTAEAIAAAVVTWLQNPRNAEIQAAAARQLVIGQYSWKKLACVLEQVWERTRGTAAKIHAGAENW